MRAMLAAAWPGVQVMDEKTGFDETWAALLKHLAVLDEGLQK